MSRVRHSLVELDYRYRTGEDKTTLENLVRAFRGIQQLPTTDPNSFCAIASYHGEPFVEDPPPEDEDHEFWGGYCNHGNVLFPTWHRAYLYYLENALRSVPGCADVTLPFWDECLGLDDFNATHTSHASGLPTLPPRGPGPFEPRIIPEILTQRKFILDGDEIDNPLYSYTLPISLAAAPGTEERYTKPEGYETVRYPLSGLVGTEEDLAETEIHNQNFLDDATNVQILNNNLANWLDGTVEITPPPSPPHTTIADTRSIYWRYLQCLQAPNYTVFSNNTSAAEATKNSAKEKLGVENPMGNEEVIVALESPHNGIHLAVGGFYQPGVYDGSPIEGANGDIGENETAAFDPIFYFHHCFVDYTFWVWQKAHGQTASGSLTITKGAKGTISTGVARQPIGSALDEDTPLYPFLQPDETPYTTKLVTDIVNQLGYDYAPGSLDAYLSVPHSEQPTPQNIVALKRVHRINRAKISGSFVIRLYAKLPSGEEFEIGREAILSRWKTAGCANCQGTLDVEALVSIHEGLHRALMGYVNGDESAISYEPRVETRAGQPVENPWGEFPPLVEDL